MQREETAAPQNRSDRVFWAVKCRGKLRTSGGSSSAGRAPVCGTGCRGFNPRLPPHPYEPAELQKLFASMDEEETVRYKFFLGTACREQEVMYAAWPDIDFARGIYHIRAKPDAGFTPKKHESRYVKMPTELVEVLKQRKKHAPHPRWIFVNGGGKPEGHFLEKLKRIAVRAKLNCGNCTAPWTEGRYPTRKITVTCKTHPVCQHHYLHRLRKTCASNWEANGVPVRTIQYMLSHTSLETTMRYLGITNLDSLTDKIDAAAAVGTADVGD